MNILPQGPAGIGEIIGQALSDVAGQFTQHKSTVKALKGLGFSDAQARAYSHLGPQAQQQAIHAQQQQQAQEREANVTQMLLNKGIGGMQPSINASAQAQPQSTPYQGIPKPQLPHEQQQAAIQQATSIAQNPNFRKLNEQQQQAQALQNQQLMQKPAAAQPTGEQQAILQAQAQEAQKEPPFKSRLEDVATRRRALVSAPISPTQKREVHKILKDEEDAIREEIKEAREENRENKKEDRKDQREANKETLETYTKTVDSYRSAKDSNATLDRMEKLIGQGLPHPLTQSAVKFLKDGIKLGKFGSILSLDVTSFLGGNAEEFNKLSNGFLRHGKEIFGSRMTDFDVDTFLQMVPSLLQTNEGKQRIINNMRALNDASVLRYDAMKEIIKENGNKRPPHLDMLIEDRIGDQLDALYAKFAAGYGPQTAPGTNSLIGDVARGVYRAIVPH
jgi:hypothetical protein